MLIKNQDVDLIDDTMSRFVFQENNLYVYSFGCLISNADAMKLFYLLKTKIKKPTLVIFICSVTEAAHVCARRNILELKEKHQNCQVFITGCINELVKDKFERFGKIIYKQDMWDLSNYEC